MNLYLQMTEVFNPKGANTLERHINHSLKRAPQEYDWHVTAYRDVKEFGCTPERVLWYEVTLGTLAANARLLPVPKDAQARWDAMASAYE